MTELLEKKKRHLNESMSLLPLNKNRKEYFKFKHLRFASYKDKKAQLQMHM